MKIPATLPGTSPARQRIARVALGDLIHRAAKRFSHRPAIFDDAGVVSFATLDAQSNRFANFLGRGMGKGTHVGMLCANSVEMVYAFLGIQKAAMVWVPINTGLAPAAIEHILDHAEIDTLVIDGDLYQRPELRALIDARGIRAIVILPESSIDANSRTISFDATMSDTPDTLPDVSIHGDDLVLIMYTSGTTGRQKGVMHSHASACAALMSNLSEYGVVSSDVANCVFPMFHVAQHAVSMTFWIGGAAIRLDRGFDAGRLLGHIADARITFLMGLPMMYGALLDHQKRPQSDLSSLRMCMYAMAPMSQTMLTELIREICPNFALCSGQTEMYPSTTMFKPEEQLRRFGPYWGSSTFANETAIMDDDGQLLGQGQVGEIVHRGPNVMLGYYKDPEATEAAFAYGWHHTGDLGKFDVDGQLLFIDRKKDLIKSGGENVPSLKVEECLLRHPGVANVAVVGLPHARWAEAVTAFVVPKPGHRVVEEELHLHCRSALGIFERPKKIIFVDALPMTTTGKIQKALLRAGNLGIYWGEG